MQFKVFLHPIVDSLVVLGINKGNRIYKSEILGEKQVINGSCLHQVTVVEITAVFDNSEDLGSGSGTENNTVKYFFIEIINRHKR